MKCCGMHEMRLKSKWTQNQLCLKPIMLNINFFTHIVKKEKGEKKEKNKLKEK